MKKRMSKVLSLVLLLGMLLSLVPAAAFAAEDTTSWQKVELADITADDTVAITMTTSAGVTYALSNTAVTKNPAAPEVSVSGTTLTANDDSLISWSVQSVDGGYTFTSGNNTLNYSDIKTAQSVRISTDAAAVWSLDENGEYLTTTSGNTTRYLGVFISTSGAGSWRHYMKGASNIANEVVSFWKLSDSTPEEPTKAATPTASPVAGEVEAGTAVTFSCATDGATIMISYDEELWFEETSITVTEDVTVYVKAVKEGLEDSDVAVFAYTLKADTPEPATTAFVPVESPEEGDKVVIYYPAGGKIVGTEEYYYNNKKYELVAVDATLAEGKLNVPEGAAILTVSVDESGSLSFKTEDGKYLFMDGTDVKFVEEAGDYTLFALEETTSTNYSGHFIKSVNAKYNDKAQYVEYYGGYFTVYGMNADKADIYTFQFFKEETDTPEPATVAKPTASPAAGEVEAGTEVTFSCATEGAVISYSTDNGATWTEGSSYTVNEGVKILVKATLGDAESEVATFTYTIKAVQPEPETVPISTALAGSDNESFTVKGVVTLLDGKNIYVQDATGGICLRLSANPSGVALGDTVIFTGAKGVYNGLPQLNGTTFDKSEGLTLEAKDTTIAALTTADVCTYVHLSGLKVTEVYDNNGAYSNPNITLEDSEGKSIQIYKAVVGKSGDAWDLIVGDVIDFRGAVGIFVKDDTATLQLRNTLTSEITVTDAAVRTPTADPAGGAVEAGTEVTFSCETAGAVISYSTDNGETWTESSSFTVTEDVTIQVKAVLGDKESAVAEFTYTVKTVAPTMLDKLTEAPADGSRVVIHYPAGNLALTATASGTKLTGTEAVPAEGQLALTDAMACLTVHVTDNVYTFELNGTYLTSGATGNSLSFADAESDYSKWTLQQQTDGTWYIVNVNAVYNDTQQAIEYYKGAFTTFSVKDNNAAYKFDFYGAAASSYGLVTDLAQLTDGAYVVIYNPGNSLAMSSETYRDWYLMPGAATITDGQVAEPAANQVWKVAVNEDGSYTFTQDPYTVAAWLDGNYVELTSNGSYNNATSNTWSLDVCNAETGTFYMRSSNLTTSNGGAYIEVYGKKVNNVSGTLVFCGYSTGTEKLNEKDYGMQFYLVPKPEAPVTEGDLITDLSQLTDGATVAIYSPSHKTAISSKPNGDWYLKANGATVENGKVSNFTSDFVWVVKKNDNGSYSFYSKDDETNAISVWPSGTYAELTVNPNYNEETVHEWNLLPFNAAEHTWYIKSSTLTLTKNNAELPVYIEAFVRNELYEVFSGYAPFQSQLSNTDYALQFYLVNPEDAIAAYDDGEWDGVLKKGEQYVAYNDTAKSAIGLFAEANYSMKAVPTTIVGDKAEAGNGAYAFTIDTMGRYYSFEVNGKYLATNNEEELFFVEKDEDGKLPENAKWFLIEKSGGYIINNKEANYGGTPVSIEYYSSVFSGWTFSTKNDVGIYLFNFYKTADGTEIRDGIVQDPAVIFDCDSSRYIEQDYVCSFSLDDLAEEITGIAISFTAGERTVDVTEYDVSSDGKSYSFTIPAKDIDGDETLTSFSVNVKVTNSYDIEYSGEKIVEILDEPFFTELTPAPNSQTRDEKKPVISAKVGNVGQAPVFTMTVNDKPVEATFENGVLSYTPAEDLTDGRVTVKITVERADGVKAEKTWNFTVGIADYQLYFGQLHSHTTYSDGSGSLDTALEYIASLPESANVQFVAFTDHSNYFDTTSAANPADALNDKSLMTDASRALWDEYKGKVAAFNETHDDLIALAGYEMTWSGGPGHINTFDSDGLVSRNNAELNNKTNDAGMKLYYETLKQGNSLNQFNHPGNTFGNFTDFSYWDEATDAHMFLVEVGNGEGQIGAGGYYPSYEQYIIALDKGWHVAPTNNQDNHKGRWGNANDARDVILTNDFSEQGIYGAIRALRVYATEDKNLQVNYTINDEPMGTIFTDENAPEKLDIAVTLYDPDTSDSVSKVELVVDGGVTAYTWDNAAELAEGQLTAELDPEYSYYFIRVTQKDGDLAVTAPIWVGNAVKLGITDIKAEAETVYKDEEATLVTTLYNNEEAEATVKSLTYTINGSEVIGTDTNGYKISAGGTQSVNFKHFFTTAKLTTVTVTAIVELDGKDYTYTANVELTILDRDAEGKITPISEVRAASDPQDTGYFFTIEGVVTSNASGYDKDTAFFDCIYVQDETGGICCFPVSGEYKIGDKVRIFGYTDFYQGEPELQVKTIEVIGEGGTVEPRRVNAWSVQDREYEGQLVTLRGTVVSFELANGLIQTIIVKDINADYARVFIDGYITTGKEVENCEVGAQIVVTGLASYDDTWPDTNYFSRIRIRDRADVVCTPAEPFTISETDITIPAQSTYKLTTKGAASVVWSSDNEKVATVDENGLVHAHLYGTAVISVTDGKTTLECTVHVLFSDVTDSGMYYYKPVYWAAENNITVGYSSGEHIGQFGVGLNCERRQLMIFLWRFAGRPGQGASVSEYGDAREMFNDLSAYSAKSDTNQAIAWAYKTGITKGYPDGGFHPTAPIVRKDVMIMLYRLAGKPDVTGTLTWPDCKDYKPTSDTYKAILWGSQKGITNGYSQGEYAGTFGATVDCLREQIVTFLYRYNNVKNANAGTSAWKEGARGPFEQNAQTGSALKTNAAAAVATPTADVQEGEVPYGTEVNLRCATEGAVILYSTDGGMNFTEGTSLTLTRTVGVYVIAEKNGLMSEPDVLTYSVQPATPTADVPSGEVEKGTVVTFSCESEGAEISYSTDGGKTWKQEDTYTINEDVTILVMATLADVDSEKAEFTYTVKTEDPTPVPDPLHIILDANGGKVSITRLRLGANGSVPALPVPQEREGYIFGGWFDAAEGGNEVVQGDILTESTTLFAHWYELRAVVTNNAVVPEALKSRYATSDAMKTAMLNTVKRRLGTTSVKGNQLYEISVEYYDGSDWLPITADQFPTKGVKVSLTIPSGSAATDRFVALHLFGEDCNGHKAGEGEMPTVTKSGNTLSFTVHGTSPLLLVWTGSGSNNGGTNGTTPKTGDEANLGLWIALMAASSAALAALVIGQKKRKNRA